MYCFARFCIVCTNETKNLTYLYSRSENDVNTNYFDMLKILYPKLINLNTDLPELICSYCIKELLNSYTFYQKCQKSETVLKSYLQYIAPDKINNKRKKIYREDYWDFFYKTKKMKFTETEVCNSFCSSKSLEDLEHINTDFNSLDSLSDATTVLRCNSENEGNTTNSTIIENENFFYSTEEIFLKYIQSNSYEFSFNDVNKIFDLKNENNTEKIPDTENKNLNWNLSSSTSNTTESKDNFDSFSEHSSDINPFLPETENTDNENTSETEKSIDLDFENTDKVLQNTENYTSYETILSSSEFSDSDYTESTAISETTEIKQELLAEINNGEYSEITALSISSTENTIDNTVNTSTNTELTENTIHKNTEFCETTEPYIAEKLKVLTRTETTEKTTDNTENTVKCEILGASEITETVIGIPENTTENTEGGAKTTENTSTEKNTDSEIIDISDTDDVMIKKEKYLDPFIINLNSEYKTEVKTEELHKIINETTEKTTEKFTENTESIKCEIFGASEITETVIGLLPKNTENTKDGAKSTEKNTDSEIIDISDTDEVMIKKEKYLDPFSNNWNIDSKTVKESDSPKRRTNSSQNVRQVKLSHKPWKTSGFKNVRPKTPPQYERRYRNRSPQNVFHRGAPIPTIVSPKRNFYTPIRSSQNVSDYFNSAPQNVNYVPYNSDDNRYQTYLPQNIRPFGRGYENNYYRYEEFPCNLCGRQCSSFDELNIHKYYCLRTCGRYE